MNGKDVIFQTMLGCEIPSAILTLEVFAFHVNSADVLFQTLFGFKIPSTDFTHEVSAHFMHG